MTQSREAEMRERSGAGEDAPARYDAMSLFHCFLVNRRDGNLYLGVRSAAGPWFQYPLLSRYAKSGCNALA